MKRIKRYFSYVRLIKKLRQLARIMTVSLPCVNLSIIKCVGKRARLLNNDDIIAELDYDELVNLASLGGYFCALVIYCLCIKYSIEKYSPRCYNKQKQGDSYECKNNCNGP